MLDQWCSWIINILVLYVKGGRVESMFLRTQVAKALNSFPYVLHLLSLSLTEICVCNERLPLLVTSKSKKIEKSTGVLNPLPKLIPFPDRLKQLMDLQGSE